MTRPTGADEAAVGATDPAAVEATEPAVPSLSPSRAADFKTCPLLYRLRAIDRVPEPPSADRARGTLVHAVLERLFDLPAAERTPQAAAGLVGPQWQQLVEQEPELATLLGGDGAGDGGNCRYGSNGEDGGNGSNGEDGGNGSNGEDGGNGSYGEDGGNGSYGEEGEDGENADRFFASARELLRGYFAVEDPRRIEPAEREYLIETVVGNRLQLRGYVDRLDTSPDGQLRVVDYKSGGAPREAFEARALFQLKFYALLLWRTRGVVPRVLRLLYLRDAEICDYTPDAEELRRFERTLFALWRAIEAATQAQRFRPSPSRLCDWCSYRHLCPEFGGTPPPFPPGPPGALMQVPEPRPGADD